MKTNAPMITGWEKTSWAASIFKTLILKELRHNWATYLFPFLFYLPLWITTQNIHHTLSLNSKGSLVVLVFAFVLAIIYGLQNFSGETDRNTLDFLLTRPVPPFLIVAAKFLVNLGIFVFWVSLFISSLAFNWSLFHFPEHQNVEIWLLISLVMVLSMGFFSGLITRGAERLLLTVGLTALMAGGSYFIWNQAFQLMLADYFWYDVPPHILSIVSFGLPLVLLVISILTPLVLTLWFLRGKSPALKYKPFHRMAIVWLSVIILVQLAVFYLGPALWPILKETPLSGDINTRSDIAVAGSVYSLKHYKVNALYLGRIGGKSHIVHKGSSVHSPTWSPDGTSVAFVDGSWIKIWSKGRIRQVVGGSFPAWSSDGKSLAFAKKSDNAYHVDGIDAIDLASGKIRPLFEAKIRLFGLVYDSQNHRLFILHQETSKEDAKLETVDTETQKRTAVVFPTSVFLPMEHPTMVRGHENNLCIGVTFEHEAHVYEYSIKKNQLSLLDSCSGHELNLFSQMIVYPNELGYLVPGVNDAYFYHGIIPPHEHHPGDKD